MNKEANRANQETTAQTSFDAIADEFVERIRQGEFPSIAQYVEAYPDFKSDIEELFPTLAKLENYDPFKAHHKQRQVSGFSVPRQFGDYEIVGELGRGGMGIVFEAINNKLKRRVALKILPADGSNPDLVVRFEREARAAGQLHHTNIVPVFDVGEFEGKHFYSMQYINGQSLDVIIEEIKHLRSQELETAVEPNDRNAPQRKNSEENLEKKSLDITVSQFAETAAPQSQTRGTDSTKTTHGGITESFTSWSQVGEKGDGYFRRVAHVGTQVAKALEYAHRQGVLHRDIKPANLLLDAEGVVWITDFGLAKDGKVALTHTGDIVGTLRYMAPERFNGHSDPRSDVYSLGLTLYELCTLKYAYDQSDRAQLIKKLTTQSPVPPRKIRPEIPIDLETIIVKAISHDPSMRYQSASQMASDLNCFLNDRPVQARRITLAERVFRWTKRNPLPATIASLLILIGIIIFSSALIFARMSNEHAVQLQQENTKVKEEKARTDEALTKLQASNRSSKGHLYHAYVGQATSRSISGAQGQNYSALSAASYAANLVRELNLSEERAAKRYLQLSQVAVRAMSNWDLIPHSKEEVKAGSTTRFATSFASRKAALIEGAGRIVLREIDDDGKLTSRIVGELESPGREAWNPVFSPSGQYLAAVYHHEFQPGDTILIVWDVNAQQEVFRSQQFLRGATVSFSRDGNTLAFCQDSKTVAIQPLKPGRAPQTIELAHRPKHLQFGGDDVVAISYADDHSIDFFRTQDEVELIESVDVGKPVTIFDWAPQLQKIAIATDNQVLIYGIDHQFQFEPSPSLSSESSTAETTMATQSDDDSDINAVNDSKAVLTFAGHAHKVVQLFLHPSGEVLISTAWDGTTRLFSIEEERETLRIDGKRLKASGFDSSGQFIAYSNKSTEIGIWKLPLDRPVATKKFSTKRGFLQRSKFVPHFSQLVVCPSNEGLKIWNHVKGKQIEVLDSGPTMDVVIQAQHDDRHAGELITSGENGTIVWNYLVSPDADSVKLTFQAKLLEGRTEQLAANPTTGSIVVRSSYEFFTVIDRSRGKTLRIGPHRNCAWATFSPDGKQLVTTTWQGLGIKVWDVDSGELIKDLSPETSTAIAKINALNDELVSYSGDRVMVWSTQNWQSTLNQKRINPDGWPGQICFSPDGRWMLSSYSRYQTQILDTKTKQLVGILDAPYRVSVSGLQWSDDSRYILVCDSYVIQVWDIQQVNAKMKDLTIDWNVQL